MSNKTLIEMFDTVRNYYGSNSKLSTAIHVTTDISQRVSKGSASEQQVNKIHSAYRTICKKTVGQRFPNSIVSHVVTR